MTSVKERLQTLSERGTPIGSSQMREQVLLELVARQDRSSRAGREAAGAPLVPITRRRRPSQPVLIAVATAVTLFVVGGALLATRLMVSDTSPIATVPETPTVPATTVPAATTLPAPGFAAGAADQVFELALAPDGSLWAATEVGVVRWDLATESPTVFTEADGLGGQRVERLAVTADGTVWAAGSGWMAYFDGTWTLLGEDVLADLADPIGDMTVDPDGIVWLAAGADTLIRFDAGAATTYRKPEDWQLTEPWTSSIAADTAGTVWASTMFSGVLAFDGEWHHFGSGEGLPSDVVGNIAVAPDGSIWVGGDGMYGNPGGGDIPAGGVLRYRDGTWTVYTTADGLLSNDGEVAIGPDGDVWVIHTSLPAEVADAVDVHLPSGLSHYDGTRWETYSDVSAGYGRAGVVSADGTLWLASWEGIVGFDANGSRMLVAGQEAVPAPGPPGAPLILHPVDGLEPVRLSTSIGEIEFTTRAVPDDMYPPWRFTATDHGVIADVSPDGTPAWSLDGVTWTEILLSVEPYGWSDQAAAYGDDLFAFVDGGVGRLAWDGIAWTEAEILPAPRVYQGAVGARGIVAVRGEHVYYWDGTGFTEASQPPDPSRHPGPSTACSTPGWTGEGIMTNLGPVAATDDGFIAFGARSEANWYRDPVCEPLVWRSDDGDIWTPTSDESPFGERSFIHDMAVVGDTIVAVGGVSRSEAAVWTSNDGFSWQRADLDAAQVWQVAGGARGWIAVGNHNSGSGGVALDGDMWFSIDGLVWDGPYERPPGWGDFTGIVGVTMLDELIVGAGERLNSTPEGSPPAGLVVGVFIDE